MITRKPNRLKNYDYSLGGCYFITICTSNRINYFGEIQDEEMLLNTSGKIAHSVWQEIPEHFSNAVLDEFAVMPNHIHGIIGIIDEFIQNDKDAYMLPLQVIDRSKMLIPKIIQQYKAAVSREINRISQTGFKWQRSFYDHIIRNERSFENIQNYIHYNIIKWEFDIENRMNNIKNTEKYYSEIINKKP